MKADLLQGITVLDLSQFLAGPLAALRLADLGARVIKVERPGTGDLCRTLYLTDAGTSDDSTLFHTINRNKEGFAADLKNPGDLARLRRLIASADVLVQNFRPGVVERLGLSPDDVQAINPRLVYASVSGYGASGPWVDRPGQDLLAQARSGLMWLNGDRDQGPVPFGLAVADMLAGHTLAQGILAALVRRGRTGLGGHVETSLLEVLVDLQFEVLTAHLNDGGRLPDRAGVANAHAYLAAPYGVYPTADGYLALAMTPLRRLAGLLDLPALGPFLDNPRAGFEHRDEIKRVVALHLVQQATAHWLSVLEPADIWCAEVLDWPTLLQGEGFRALDMLQRVVRPGGGEVRTTRMPLRIDGVRPESPQGAPAIGEHSSAIAAEFGL